MQPNLTFEHLALNVEDKGMAERWYTAFLNLRVVRSVPDGPSFLADQSGRVVLELYSRDDTPRLNFAQTEPLTMHLAFHVHDVEGTAENLMNAGATVAEPMKQAGGDEMIMLRDPFGLPIQLVHREQEMF
jgi:catechol 2,3-dioxygenase-like lactoylglutathione lyase family enzyme